MFDANKLNPKGTETVFTIKTAFHDLLKTVEKTGTKQGREYALFKTKLEEACFWGVRAASVDGSNVYTENVYTESAGEETGQVVS